MKYILTLIILAALLGGCAVAPAAGDRQGDYNRDDGVYRSRDYNDANYHHYSYRGEHGDQGDPHLAAIGEHT
jgi:hypothetical protein